MDDIEDLFVLDEICDIERDKVSVSDMSKSSSASSTVSLEEDSGLETLIDELSRKDWSSSTLVADMANTNGVASLQNALRLESDFLRLVLKHGPTRVSSLELGASFNIDTRGIWQSISFQPTADINVIVKSRRDTPLIAWDGLIVTHATSTFDLKVTKPIQSVGIIFTPDSKCSIFVDKVTVLSFHFDFGAVFGAADLSFAGNLLNHCTLTELE